MAWPHVHLLLGLLSSFVRQPLAIPLYVTFLLFTGIVSALIGKMSLRAAIATGERRLNTAVRQGLLPRLRNVALRRGVILIAVIAGTESGVGILGSFYTNQWSVDNVVFGLLIIGITITLLVPVVGVMYAVWRLYLMRYGYFVPSE